MADDLDQPTDATAPSFDLSTMRTGRCSIVAAARAVRGIELCFGVIESRQTCTGSVGPRLAHRVRLDTEAARHLEEALTRVLGAQPAAAVSQRT